MPDLLQRPQTSHPAAPAAPADERLARAELRRQIARLEAELGRLLVDAFPRFEAAPARSRGAAPRLLGLGELERIRDELALRVRDAGGALEDRLAVERRNRELLERMIADPASHRWLRISNEDIGRPGCGHWHSRPRLGLLGMLMGWWRVRHSSGCPLAKGRPRASRTKKRLAKSRRRRKRRGAPRPAAPPARRREPAAAGRRGREEPPSAPWGSFPLAELAILTGIVILVVGFAGANATLVVVGLALGGLGGLEVAVREHFAGYRSHSTLLAAPAFVLTTGLLIYLTELIPLLCIAAGAVAFGLAFLALRRAFRRVSGGLSYRVGGLSG